MTDAQRRILEGLADPATDPPGLPRLTPRERAAIQAILVERDRLEAERDGYRRGLALVQGEVDPDWDLKFAAVLIENATLVREVERLREGEKLRIQR